MEIKHNDCGRVIEYVMKGKYYSVIRKFTYDDVNQTVTRKEYCGGALQYNTLIIDNKNKIARLINQGNLTECRVSYDSFKNYPN